MAFSTVSFDIVDVPLQSHSRPPKKQEKVKKKIFWQNQLLPEKNLYPGKRSLVTLVTPHCETQETLSKIWNPGTRGQIWSDTCTIVRRQWHRDVTDIVTSPNQITAQPPEKSFPGNSKFWQKHHFFLLADLRQAEMYRAQDDRSLHQLHQLLMNLTLDHAHFSLATAAL